MQLVYYVRIDDSTCILESSDTANGYVMLFNHFDFAANDSSGYYFFL